MGSFYRFVCSLICVSAVLCFCSLPSVGALVTIDFEDVAVATGVNDVLDGAAANVTSRGYNFNVASDHSHLINDRFDSWNGTTWFGLDRELDVVTMTPVAGGTFSLLRAQFSEFSNSNEGADEVRVVGNLSGGGTVGKTVQLDGIADGAGAANDFQSEGFDGSWSNLVSVTFVGANGGTSTNESTDRWSLDNVVVDNVPEPATLLLASCGILGMLSSRRRR